MNHCEHSILGTIGRTPCLRLRHLAPPGINLYARLGTVNSASAIKDRFALALLDEERKHGMLRPGQTVVDVSDGVTGLGLAMACAYRGHPLVVVMDVAGCKEQRTMLRHLGARVIITRAPAGRKDLFRKAWRLANDHDGYLVGQHEATVNNAVQARTIVREIMEDFEEKGPDYLVVGQRTAGVASDIAHLLKTQNTGRGTIVCRPIASGTQSLATAEPRLPTLERFGALKAVLRGVGLGRETGEDTGWSDTLVTVSEVTALQTACDAVMREGIFCGHAGGMALAAALEVCATAPAGSTVLCLLPDLASRGAVARFVDRDIAGFPEDAMAVSEKRTRPIVDALPANCSRLGSRRHADRRSAECRRVHAIAS